MLCNDEVLCISYFPTRGAGHAFRNLHDLNGFINAMKGTNYERPHRPKSTHFSAHYNNVLFLWPKIKFPVHTKPQVILIFLYNLIIRFSYSIKKDRGTVVAESLRCCVTNRKVAGSIPNCVIGIFH